MEAGHSIAGELRLSPRRYRLRVLRRLLVTPGTNGHTGEGGIAESLVSNHLVGGLTESPGSENPAFRNVTRYAVNAPGDLIGSLNGLGALGEIKNVRRRVAIHARDAKGLEQAIVALGADAFPERPRHAPEMEGLTPLGGNRRVALFTALAAQRRVDRSQPHFGALAR